MLQFMSRGDWLEEFLISPEFEVYKIGCVCLSATVLHTGAGPSRGCERYQFHVAHVMATLPIFKLISNSLTDRLHS